MRRYILLLTMLISVTSFAQKQLTVEEAVQIALEKNFGIKAARNTSKMSKNKATLGNAGLLPKLELNASTSYMDTEQDNVSGSINNQQTVSDGKVDVANTQNNASINLSYTLVNGLGNIYNYKKLRLQAEGSHFQTKYKIETTVFNVVNMFYAVATQEDNLKRAKEMLQISNERLVRSEAKTELGTGSSLDVLNARVDYNKDSVSYISSEKNYLDAKRNLNNALSRDIDTDFHVDLGVVEFKDYKLEDLLDKAFESNSDYLLSLNKLEQSKYDLKIAKSSIFPTISIKSSYGYNKMNQDFDLKMDNANASLTTGLTLSWNIFDGRKKSIQKKNARLSIENSEYQLDEQRLNIRKEISNAYATYENSLKVLSVEKSNLKSAEMNFNQSKEYYNLGQISSTRFREAQLNLLTANNNISAARYIAKVAEMDLNRLCGLIVQQN